MKTLLSFFAGCLLTTAAVVLAGGYHAGMVILGGILTVLALVASVWALGIPRVCRWLLAFNSANQTAHVGRGRRVSGVGAPHGDRRPIAAVRRSRAGNSGNVVALPKTKMLATVQQDVLSALVNLKVPFSQAERAVLDCYKPGDSFDDLFKRAIPVKRTA
jgi:hypothetical protein